MRPVLLKRLPASPHIKNLGTGDKQNPKIVGKLNHTESVYLSLVRHLVRVQSLWYSFPFPTYLVTEGPDRFSFVKTTDTFKLEWQKISTGCPLSSPQAVGWHSGPAPTPTHLSWKYNVQQAAGSEKKAQVITTNLCSYCTQSRRATWPNGINNTSQIRLWASQLKGNCVVDTQPETALLSCRCLAQRSQHSFTVSISGWMRSGSINSIL